MVDSTKYEVKGLKELQKVLKTLDEDIIKDATRKSAIHAMRPVLARAYTSVPFKSGALRDSLTIRSGSSSGKSRDRIAWAYVGAGGKKKKGRGGPAAGEYILAAHYGTTFTKGDPFLEDAFVPYVGAIINDFRRELTRQTDKGVKKMKIRKGLKQ
jgi:HK97 gp10 family phage protein